MNLQILFNLLQNIFLGGPHTFLSASATSGNTSLTPPPECFEAPPPIFSCLLMTEHALLSKLFLTWGTSRNHMARSRRSEEPVEQVAVFD